MNNRNRMELTFIILSIKSNRNRMKLTFIILSMLVKNASGYSDRARIKAVLLLYLSNRKTNAWNKGNTFRESMIYDDDSNEHHLNFLRFFNRKFIWQSFNIDLLSMNVEVKQDKNAIVG